MYALRIVVLKTELCSKYVILALEYMKMHKLWRSIANDYHNGTLNAESRVKEVILQAQTIAKEESNITYIKGQLAGRVIGTEAALFRERNAESDGKMAEFQVVAGWILGSVSSLDQNEEVEQGFRKIASDYLEFVPLYTSYAEDLL